MQRVRICTRGEELSKYMLQQNITHAGYLLASLGRSNVQQTYLLGEKKKGGKTEGKSLLTSTTTGTRLTIFKHYAHSRMSLMDRYLPLPKPYR